MQASSWNFLSSLRAVQRNLTFFWQNFEKKNFFDKTFATTSMHPKKMFRSELAPDGVTSSSSWKLCSSKNHLRFECEKFASGSGSRVRKIANFSRDTASTTGREKLLNSFILIELVWNDVVHKKKTTKSCFEDPLQILERTSQEIMKELAQSSQLAGLLGKLKSLYKHKTWNERRISLAIYHRSEE